MRERRARYEGDDAKVLDILETGCTRANHAAEQTLAQAKKAARLSFFDRELRYK